MVLGAFQARIQLQPAPPGAAGAGNALGAVVVQAMGVAEAGAAVAAASILGGVYGHGVEAGSTLVSAIVEVKATVDGVAGAGRREGS